MNRAEVKITPIGNSNAIRLPAKLLRRYQIRDKLTMELRLDEIALRPKHAGNQKLTWTET